MAIYKAYLPRWGVWVGVIFTVPMWAWMTWLAFLAEGPEGDEMTLGVWALMTVVLGAVLALLVLLGTHRLAAYEIEIPDLPGSDEE